MGLTQQFSLRGDQLLVLCYRIELNLSLTILACFDVKRKWKELVSTTKYHTHQLVGDNFAL